ncbi:hypothetical protein GQ53DRAFT_28049 [Thozetella sp. PMI_491]|nr:hypothetical protein GQ53DRAFT_28049 [Thozetella sp. PMI_491]
MPRLTPGPEAQLSYFLFFLSYGFPFVTLVSRLPLLCWRHRFDYRAIGLGGSTSGLCQSQPKHLSRFA